jgi:hypothetical protein
MPRDNLKGLKAAGGMALEGVSTIKEAIAKFF